jgi:hypothetical protein
MTRLAALVALLAACASPQPCPKPLVECGGQCVDIQSSHLDCGACGRTCAAGEVCLGAACTGSVRPVCQERTGGAYVTLGECGSVVKLWIRRPDFIDEAASYVGTTATPRTPVLNLVRGTDCDAQWSWSVDEMTPTWVTSVTGAACDACPAEIEAAARTNALPPLWCPTPTTSLVLAVDRRPTP